MPTALTTELSHLIKQKIDGAELIRDLGLNEFTISYNLIIRNLSLTCHMNLVKILVLI